MSRKNRNSCCNSRLTAKPKTGDEIELPQMRAYEVRHAEMQQLSGILLVFALQRPGHDGQDQTAWSICIVKHRYLGDLSFGVDPDRISRVHVAVEVRKRARRHLQSHAMTGLKE